MPFFAACEKSPPGIIPILLSAAFLLIATEIALAENSVPSTTDPKATMDQVSSLPGWEKASTFLFDEAHEHFARSAKLVEGPEARAMRLGEGLTLLGVQPRTQSNIGRARSIFEELISENPKDEAGLAARMHLARLYEFHLSPGQPRKAREIYEGLLEDGIGNPLAELAASRLGLMDLYAAETEEERDALAKQLAPLGSKLKTSSGRREFYSNLGITLYQLRGDKKLAMEFLIAAEAEGFPAQQFDSPILRAIGGLAEELGDLDTAKKYYFLFLSRYKRDPAYFSVLEKLQSWGVPAPGA